MFALPAICQPFAEIRLRKHQFNDDIIGTIDSVYRFWNNRKDITIKDGLVYKYSAGPKHDTLQFFHTGPDEWDVTMTFKKKGVIPPLPDIITDIDDSPTDTRNKYTLAWVNSVNAPWNANHLGKTASYTVVKDGSLETTFDGYKVEWFTEKRVNHGIAAVSIDGGPEISIDLYDPRTDNASMKVWTSPVLTSGVHKIKIRCTLTKSNTGTGTDTNIIHDYFKILKKQ